MHAIISEYTVFRQLYMCKYEQNILFHVKILTLQSEINILMVSYKKRSFYLTFIHIGIKKVKFKQQFWRNLKHCLYTYTLSNKKTDQLQVRYMYGHNEVYHFLSQQSVEH